jgi:hypothetical protein
VVYGSLSCKNAIHEFIPDTTILPYPVYKTPVVILKSAIDCKNDIPNKQDRNQHEGQKLQLFFGWPY